MTSRSDIGDRDQERLRWYFSQTAFERSTAGAMIERAEQNLAAMRKHAVERNQFIRTIRAELRAQKADMASQPWDLAPITARPTCETHAATGYEPDPQAHEWSAYVERRLMAMERASAHRAMAALTVYFGAVGERYERGAIDDRGVRSDRPADRGQLHRWLALLFLTHAGNKLLEQAGKLPGVMTADVPPYERMRVHLLMRERNAYAPLREQFAQAELEAEALYREMVRAWSSASIDIAKARAECMRCAHLLDAAMRCRNINCRESRR